MTKKDYIAIAKILKEVRGTNYKHPENMCDHVAYRLCDVFQADNSAFDRNRFLLACGVPIG